MRKRFRRRLRTVGMVLAGVAIGLIAGTRLTHPTDPDRPAAPNELSGAEAALSRVLPEVILDEVPFDKAIGQIQPLCGAPLVVHWERLRAAGHDTQFPVTFRARNVRVGDLLFELVSRIGTDSYPVAYAPYGDAILISTAADIRPSDTVVRAYDVRDLILKAASDRWRGLGTHTLVVYPGTIPANPAPADELIRQIQEAVAPDSWSSLGGPGAARYFAGRLIVTQSWQAHWQIAALLDTMREPVPPVKPQPPVGPDLMVWDAKLKTYVSTNDEVGASALRLQLAEVRLEAEPFDEALSAVAGLSHANLVADWQTMESLGVDRRTPVTLHLHDVTLADALRALLDAAGAGRRLSFEPAGGYVNITSGEAAAHSALTRVYDVRGLLSAVAGPPPPVASTGFAAWQAAAEVQIDRLIKVIEAGVEPDSWKDIGGQVGAIGELNGQLVVRQSWENHQRLAGLLNALRADPARLRISPAVPVPPLTRPATPP